MPRHIALLPLLLACTLLLPAYAQTTPNSLNLTVFEDGVVQVEYIVSVDPTYPAVNITLFGQTFEDLIIVDENTVPLDYSLIGDVVMVHTLGASSVTITYSTSDLTNKVGRFWSLNISSPVAVRVVLPLGASIISLSSIPESIESKDGRTIVVMPEGPIEITYVIGIVGTKEHAWAAILSAEAAIEEIKGRGVVVDEAEAILSQAKDEFGKGNYAKAEELAKQAEETAKRIGELADNASTMIGRAEEAIAKAEGEGKDVKDARELLNRAKDEFGKGNYELALSLAGQARAKAEEAKVEEGAQPAFPYLEILAAIAIIGIVAAVLLLLRRPTKYVKEVRKVNLEKIFEERPGLRPEDREAIEFLAEAGGEAFESELRDRFKLPRTTVWRMVKRLEREGLVEIKKVGGQNLIKIKEEFCE